MAENKDTEVEDKSKTHLNRAQLVAIIIAGIWVFMQFVYHDIYLVSKSPLNPEVTINITPYSSNDNIKVISVTGKITNRGARKIYLTNGFYHASTASITDDLLDDNKFKLKMDFNKFPKKFVIRNVIKKQKYISVGPMHSDVKYLSPGESAQYQVQIPVNREDGKHQIVSISEHMGIGGEDEEIELEAALVTPNNKKPSYDISFCKRVSVGFCQTILDFNLMKGVTSEDQLNKAMNQVYYEKTGAFKEQMNYKKIHKYMYKCKKTGDCKESMKSAYKDVKQEIAMINSKLETIMQEKTTEYNKLRSQAAERLSDDKCLLQSSEFKWIKRSGNIYISWSDQTGSIK